MFYHVRLFVRGTIGAEAKFDLSRDELESRILGPYRTLVPIVLGGRTILVKYIERIEVVETDEDSSHFSDFAPYMARQGGADWYYGLKGARVVTDEFITTPSIALLPQKTDAIELICSRFHSIAVQLKHRHNNRPALEVKDEYDVQDLINALLRLFFKDIRPEEVTPGYAGKSSRMDFLLHDEETVVETKMTREGLGAKEVGSQLIEDIARYKANPRCKALICFVYDPEGRIANPSGIERDLSHKEDNFEVQVFVSPQP